MNNIPVRVCYIDQQQYGRRQLHIGVWRLVFDKNASSKITTLGVLPGYYTSSWLQNVCFMDNIKCSVLYINEFNEIYAASKSAWFRLDAINGRLFASSGLIKIAEFFVWLIWISKGKLSKGLMSILNWNNNPTIKNMDEDFKQQIDALLTYIENNFKYFCCLFNKKQRLFVSSYKIKYVIFNSSKHYLYSKMAIYHEGLKDLI